VQLFIMRLFGVGTRLSAAYLSEAQEVFLDGHVRAFSHFGVFLAASVMTT